MIALATGDVCIANLNPDENMEMSYSKAMQELDAIVAKMQSDNCDIDALADYTKRAAELIKYCREKLFSTDEEVKKCIASFNNPQ